MEGWGEPRNKVSHFRGLSRPSSETIRPTSHWPTIQQGSRELRFLWLLPHYTQQ